MQKETEMLDMINKVQMFQIACNKVNDKNNNKDVLYKFYQKFKNPENYQYLEKKKRDPVQVFDLKST